MVIGRHGPESRIIYLIDYGMAREYAIWEEGCVRIRRQREHVLMRAGLKNEQQGIRTNNSLMDRTRKCSSIRRFNVRQAH
ncbi:unnamed protein product [Gongylonema pulchrum]|uniref:Protein kinase domain-containing protein n=1 Tax=Gongylonema pulchrum TaxID=637853 RepID=A0A183EGJ9_9BILA|nr:unnamed protein product [Gongylonema pulchrum]VDN35284.1 unnamed protein product [Gongylonema pulchrum]